MHIVSELLKEGVCSFALNHQVYDRYMRTPEKKTKLSKLKKEAKVAKQKVDRLKSKLTDLLYKKKERRWMTVYIMIFRKRKTKKLNNLFKIMVISNDYFGRNS